MRAFVGAVDQSTAPEVARLVAPLLGWDENTITEDVRHCRARVTAEQHAHGIRCLGPLDDQRGR